MRHIGHISVILFSLFLVSCSGYGGVEPVAEPQPAELSLNIDLSHISSALQPCVATKSGDSDYQSMVDAVESDEIRSLGVCIVNKKTQRLVAYRIFAKPKEDGKRYFFYNRYQATDYYDHSYIIPHLPYDEIGGVYASGLDDGQFSDEASFGINGFTDGGRAVEMTFRYASPAHGPVERLVAGEYVLCVIANFDESPLLCFDRVIGHHIREIAAYWQRNYMTGSGYNAAFGGFPPLPAPDPLAEGGSIRGYYQLLNGRLLLSDAHVDFFHAEGDYRNTPVNHGTGSVQQDDVNDRISSASYLRDGHPTIIASVLKELTLKSGQNHFDFKLKRTDSRTTVTLQNESTLPVRINRLSFCDRYACAASFLFAHSGESVYAPDFISPQWMGRPDLTSPNSIFPFDSTRVYSTLGQTELLFDGLTAPARSADSPMTMTMEVELLGNLQGTTSLSSIADTITDHASLLAEVNGESWAVGEERCFLIQFTKPKDQWSDVVNQFVSVTEDSSVPPKGNSSVRSIAAASSLAFGHSYEYVWVLKKVREGDDNRVIIRNYRYHGWIKATGTDNKNGNEFAYTDDESQATRFAVTNYAPNGVTTSVSFTSTYNGTEIYIHSLNNGNWVTISQWNDAGSHVNLYEVEWDTVIPPSVQTRETVLKYFNQYDGIPAPLYRINGNDHINIHVIVRFNEISQQLDFEVRDWNRSDNDVTFN